MPNDVINHASISHRDVNQLKGLYKSLMFDSRLCLYVLPIPKELETRYEETSDDDPVQQALKKKYGVATSLDFRRSRWGLSREIYDIENLEMNDNTLSMKFSSAWLPPVGGKSFIVVELFHTDDACIDSYSGSFAFPVYMELEKNGYQVKASWYDPGAGFLGSFDLDFEVDHVGRYDSRSIRAVIGDTLDDLYGVSKWMRECEEEEEEEEEDAFIQEESDAE